MSTNVATLNAESGTFPGLNLGGSAIAAITAYASGNIIYKPAPTTAAVAIDLSVPQTVYDQIASTQNLTFSPDSNAIPGARSIVRLLANGTNTIAFSGIKERATSAFVNTAGILNVIEFLFDGIDYWANVYSEKAAVADTTIPTLVSALYGTVSNKIKLTFSELLSKNFTPATTAFSLSGNRVVNSINISGKVVTLTLSPAYIGTDTPTISYAVPTVNKLQDNYGNLVAAIVNTPITVSST